MSQSDSNIAGHHANLELSGTEMGTKKIPGRKASEVWSIFTDDENPHVSGNANRCNYCKTMISHHKHVKVVKEHLNRCKPFKKEMMRMNVDDRPDWFNSVKRSADNSPLPFSSLSTRKKAKMAQSIMSEYLIPQLTEAEQKAVQKKLALHYYCSGTSFQRIEDPQFREALQILRPDVKIPNRKQLAGPLLDQVYLEMSSKIKKKLKEPNTTVCIVTDGWSNVMNDPIVNFIASNSKFSLFLEAVPTYNQGHTAEWIASNIERVINAVEAEACGACTDNTSANKAAWKILEEKFPSMFFHGCVSHGLNLLIKDIFAPTKTNGQYPLDYPFDELSQFADQCRDIVKFFHNHHVPKANLEEMQKAAGIKKLVKPAATRWGTIRACFLSILESEQQLHSIVTSRDFITGNREQKDKRTELKRTITDPQFVALLKKSVSILDPIDALITYFQSDGVPVSEVFHAFQNTLPEKIRGVTGISLNERDYLLKLCQERFEFMYGDGHGVAYILDPRYFGQGINDRQFRKNLEEFIITFPVDDNTPTSEERQATIYKELTDFLIEAQLMKNGNKMAYKGVANKLITVADYWLTTGRSWPTLQKIAAKVFNLVASSAASERNWSTFGFIHSKLRNSLHHEKVEKLVYVKTNHALFNKIVQEDQEGSDNDYEEELDDQVNDLMQ
jgi:hypothetical protein